MNQEGLRYWDGRGWTNDVRWEGRNYRDHLAVSDIDAAVARAEAATARAYIDDACLRGLISRNAADILRHDLDRVLIPAASTETAAPAAGPVPVPTTPTATATTATTARPMPPPTRPMPTAPAPAATVVRPAPAPVEVPPRVVAVWWERVRHAVASDLAVHGLAYLGVVLLFAGVFGLIAFSFGEVRPAWRGVADIAAPGAFFLSAWYLHRRRATAVSAALTVLGGAILPIVAIASVTDGGSVPPDITGAALPITQAAICAAIAAATAYVVHRSAESMLRFTALPTLWIGVGALGAIFRDPIPQGEAVARPVAIQFAMMLAAIAATMAVLPRGRGAGTLVTATRQVAVPFAAVAYLLELIRSAGTHWPTTSGVVAAVSMLAILEFAPRWVPADVVAVGQVIAVAAGVSRLFSIEDHWMMVATVALMLGMVEWQGWRHRNLPGVVAAAVVAALALLPAAITPTTGMVGFGLAAAWLLWRHVAPPAWWRIPDRYGLLPAAMLAAMAVEEAVEIGGAWATFTVAALALSIGVARLLLAPVRDDPLWGWWVPTSAFAAIGLTAAVPWGTDRAIVAATAGMGAVALAMSGGIPVGPRTWLCTAAAGWAVVNLAELGGLSPATQRVSFAAVALVGVVAGSLVEHRVVRHLAYTGHLVGWTMIGLPFGAGWTRVTVVALATAAALVVTVCEEWRGARHFDALLSMLADNSDVPTTGLPNVPVVLAATGATATTVLTLEVSGWVTSQSAWNATAVSVAMLLLALCARLVHWRRADRTVLAWSALLASLVAGTVTASRDLPPWPTITALILALAVVLVTSPRPMPFVVVGWALTAPLAVLLVQRTGLERRWADLTLMTWGALLVLGVSVIDRRRSGPAVTDRWVRSADLVPPAVLGSAGLAAGVVVALARATPTFAGGVCLALAGVTLAVALLRPLAVLSGLAESLAVVGLLLVVPWHMVQHPWSLVPAAAVLLAVSWAERIHRPTPVLDRWDLPAFVVAHAVGFEALASTAQWGSAVATSLSLAVLALLVGLLLPHPAWLLAAAALTLLGAGDAGLGWLALALVTEAGIATVLGLRNHGRIRVPLLATGGVLAGLAWVITIVWQEWSAETVLFATAPTAAAIVLAGAVALRLPRIPRDLIEVWITVGSIASLASMALVDQPGVHRLAGGLAVAGALAVLALAAGLSGPEAGGLMRWASIALVAGAFTAAGWALELHVQFLAVALPIAALAVFAVLLVAHALRPEFPWIPPVLAMALLAQAGGTLAAFDRATATHGPVMLVLLTAAAESAALAVIVAQPDVFVLTPCFTVAGWLVFAAEELRGEPNWFSVPVGVTILAVVGLVRWIRRGRGGRVTGGDIVALEVLGMSCMVGASLGQIVADSLWYTLLAVGIGTALAFWGVITRVRRRVGFAAAVIVLAVALVIGVPFAHTVPELRGPALWLTIAAVGVAAILIATLIEQGKARMRHLVEIVEEWTNEWEHTGGPDVAHHVLS